MTTTYSKGIPGELFEIRDFINMVFSVDRQPHDFRKLLPKLYEDYQNTEKYHYLAKEDGKIKAALCVLSGRRQRYQYFGYELGGEKLEFQFIPDNFTTAGTNSVIFL